MPEILSASYLPILGPQGFRRSRKQSRNSHNNGRTSHRPWSGGRATSRYLVRGPGIQLLGLEFRGPDRSRPYKISINLESGPLGQIHRRTAELFDRTRKFFVEAVERAPDLHYARWKFKFKIGLLSFLKQLHLFTP